MMQCNICNKNISKSTPRLYKHVKHAHKIDVYYKKVGSSNDNIVPYAFKKRSWVWYYFTRITKDSSQCKLCATIISQSCNNNGNLNRHLKSIHKITEKQGKHINIREKCNALGESIMTSDGDKSITEGCVDETGIAGRPTNEDPDDIELKDTKVLDRTDITSSEHANYLDVTNLTSEVGTEHDMPHSLDSCSRVWIYFNQVSKRCSWCKLCAKRINHGNNIQENLNRHLKWKHNINTFRGETNTTYESERPRWSWVWKYFKRVSYSCSQCILCSRKICHGKKATGNLNRHFMRHHKYEFSFEKNVQSLHAFIVRNINSTDETNITSKETQDSYTNDAYNETVATKAISELSDEKELVTESIIEASTDMDGPTSDTIKLHNETELASSINKSVSESKLATEKIMELLEDRTDITKRCRSWVWLYYISVSLSLAQCKICDKLISHGGRGTGNMARHLKRRHKIENPLERNIASLPNITLIETTDAEPVTDDNNDWIWPLFENESDDVYKCIICQYKCIRSIDERKTIDSILEHLKTIHGLLSAEQVVIEDDTTASVEN